jgi:hypothetical protein
MACLNGGNLMVFLDAFKAGFAACCKAIARSRTGWRGRSLLSLTACEDFA